jgi:organic radical activating enzyme
MKKASHFKPLVVSNLDLHVVNSCNLRCYGCNHLANYGYDGLFTENELVDWIEPWKNRLQSKRISLPSGVPLSTAKKSLTFKFSIKERGAGLNHSSMTISLKAKNIAALPV